MQRGRPRKPTAQKALAGTLRKDRTNPAEPSGPPTALPEPPQALTEDERAAWLELKALIDPMQVATAADVYAFRRMVSVAGVLATLTRSYYASPEDGGAGGKPTYWEDTQAGAQLRQRPEPNMIATFEKALMLHMAQWGISPATRSKVSMLAGEKPKANPVDRFRVVK